MKGKAFDMRVIILTLMALFFSPGINQALGQNRVDNSIVVDGRERTYRLYVPKVFNGKQPVPLLIALHGQGGNGKSFEEKTTLGGFDKLAKKENFIIVYPESIEKAWNDGRNDPYSYSAKQNLDDVHFISVLIDQLKEKYNIDSQRIFVTGMSNGGMMTFRLGGELSGKIRAIATVAASLPENLYKTLVPSNKISVLMIHGKDDPIIPWDGGDIRALRKNHGRVVSIPQTETFWIKHNNCTLKTSKTYLPDVDKNDGTRVWKEEYANKEEGLRVVLYGIDGGGHRWPGGSGNPREKMVGKSSQDINACNVIWDFFKELKK